MQNPTASQDAPPAPAPVPAMPQPAPVPRVTITTSEGGRAIAVQSAEAMTVQDVQALEARRSELESQLRDAQQQRREVASELGAADPAAREGLQARLTVIDDRIVQLERGITTVGQELTSVPASVAMAVEQHEQEMRAARNNDEEEMFWLGSVLTAGLFGVVLLVRRWRHKRRRPRQDAISGMGADRFTRLEQAVDAIAVEVERISEGQRFQAKLMAESHERSRRESMAKDAAGGSF